MAWANLTATATWAATPAITPVAVGNIPGLVYQSVTLALPLMIGMPLAMAAVSYAETKLSDDGDDGDHAFAGQILLVGLGGGGIVLVVLDVDLHRMAGDAAVGVDPVGPGGGDGRGLIARRRLRTAQAGDEADLNGRAGRVGRGQTAGDRWSATCGCRLAGATAGQGQRHGEDSCGQCGGADAPSRNQHHSLPNQGHSLGGVSLNS